MTELRERLQAVLGTAYRIEGELGSGGMSRVFVASETALARRVVVKVLPPQLAVGINGERFRREIQLAASLQHPHIVPLLAAGGSGDVFYYTMPLVEGESLRSRLARQHRLSIRDVLRTLRDIADALAYAHARGIVHRDIKPANVLLSDGHAVVTDFGVAKALTHAGAESNLTTLGMAIGTPAYMAPEQAAGDPNVDARADIYALGVTAYEMLAGVSPFGNRAPHQMLAAHVMEPVKPIGMLRPDTPPPVADLVMQCLEKDPAHRPANAAALRDALEERTGALHTPPESSARPRRSRSLALAATAVAGLVSLAWFAFRTRTTAFLDPNRVAVAPFDVLDPSLVLWHEGLVDVMSRSLDGAGPLRSVSPTLVVRRWRGRADRASAQALGRETGAQTVLFGGLVRAGPDSVRLSATVFDVAHGSIIAEMELRDRADRMDRISDALAVAVLRELDRGRPIGLVRGTPLGSASLPALKAFLAGEQFLRRSEWDSAIVYDQRAIALDSGFALAWSHAGLAAGWAHSAQDTFSLRYKLRAGSLNRGLAPRESLIVQAESLGSMVYGGAPKSPGASWSYARRMLATLTEAVRRYPNDPELWYMLGDAAFHAGQPARIGPEQSLAAFDRSIALDSAFTPSYVHAIQLALELRGKAVAQRYATSYLRAGAAGDYAVTAELLLRLLGDDPRSPANLRFVDSASAMSTHLAALAIAAWRDSAETGLWFLQRHTGRMLREARAANDSEFAKFATVQALAYRGHVQQALDIAGSQISRSFVDKPLRVSADSADRIFRAWVAGAGRIPSVARRLSLALPWWAGHRDTVRLAAAERWVNGRMRETGSRAEPMKDLFGYFAQSTRAYTTLARGDTATALRMFEALPESTCAALCDLDQLTRARLLERAGRFEAAARVLAPTPGYGWPITMSFTPERVLWELERGRVRERLGQRDAARRSYEFVAEAWIHADSALHPYLEEARAGLGRLGAEPTAR